MCLEAKCARGTLSQCRLSLNNSNVNYSCMHLHIAKSIYCDTNEAMAGPPQRWDKELFVGNVLLAAAAVYRAMLRDEHKAMLSLTAVTPISTASCKLVAEYLGLTLGFCGTRLRLAK